MKCLRIYKTKGQSLTCEVYPSFKTDDGDFLSPNEVAPLTLTINPIGSKSRRFVVFSHPQVSVSDAFILSEIERFCQTLKQMYEL